ncbi:MAG: hypothetical protein ACAI25_11450, partial [Planctomycetota bacterium]
MSDEDLRELERRAAVDAASALRFARALARSGDEPRAANELARIVDANPTEQDALVELDRITRGGVDPASPWPGGRGDGRRSARSRAEGPRRGGQVQRAIIDVSRARRGIAVDALGRVLVVAEAPGEPGTVLVAASADGSIEKLGPTGADAPLRLAGFDLIHQTSGREKGVFLHAMGAGIATVRGPWIAGLGHVVFAKTVTSIEARQLPTRNAPLRWQRALPRRTACMALGPGAVVLVLSSSGLGARGTFHRFELGTGHALPAMSLERLGTVDGEIVAAEDGTVYLGLGGSTLALDAEGQPLWRHERSGTPVALAGEGADILVVSDHDTLAPRALDARTGVMLWESRDACLNARPKVDATGRIFWRREQELIAFAPRTGEIVYQALVGAGIWDFAFDGRGHALALRY